MAIRDLTGQLVPKQSLEFGAGSVIIDAPDNIIDHGTNFGRWSGTGTTTASNGVTLTQGVGNTAQLTVPLQASAIYWCRLRFAARTQTSNTIRINGTTCDVGIPGSLGSDATLSATIDAVTNRIYFRLQAANIAGPHLVSISVVGGGDGDTLRFDEFNIYPHPPTDEIIMVRGDTSSSYNATEGRDVMNCIMGVNLPAYTYPVPFPGFGYPKFILTPGDNGDPSAGQLYSDTYGPLKTWCDQRGTIILPTVGNHDYTYGMPAFQNYFGIYPPDGLQTWSYKIGQIEFFFMDAYTIAAQSTTVAQAKLTANGIKLLRLLNSSTARFKVMVGHYPAYVSVDGYWFSELRWNWWADHGVCVYISGHAHVYERVHQQNFNGFPSFMQLVCGRGGSTAAGWGTIDSGSQARLAVAGYMRIYDGARGNSIWFEYFDTNQAMRDRVKITI